MKKLKLELEELRVESLETGSGEETVGTVRGRNYATDVGTTCDGRNTCWDSCDGVCGTYYCAPTDGDSCKMATCIINTCQSCAFTCLC